MLSSILKATNDLVTSGLLMATLMLKTVCRQPVTQGCPCCCGEVRQASGAMMLLRSWRGLQAATVSRSQVGLVHLCHRTSLDCLLSTAA